MTEEGVVSLRTRSRCRAVCTAPDDDSKESKQLLNKRVMTYHQMIMSYLNKIQFWTEQLADAKAYRQSRYSLARCEESLAHFTEKQETLLERRVDAVAESLTESRTRRLRELRSGGIEFTNAHYDVITKAVTELEEQVYKAFLSYDEDDATHDKLYGAMFDVVCRELRKQIQHNA